MLQTQRYGIQVSRYTRDKQTNKQTNKPTDYYTRGRPRASGNKPTDYYTRGRPRAPRVTNQQTTIPVAAHARLG